jgi:hypothetical protein
MNKRVYTFEEALQTIRSQMKLRRIMARGNIVPGARRRHNHVSFDSPVDGEIPAPSPPNTVDAVLLAGWKEGILLARKHATEDDMKPVGRGPGPQWWSHPHKADPNPTVRRNQAAPRGEEDLLVEDDNEDDDDDDDGTDGDEDNDDGPDRQQDGEDEDWEGALAGVVIAGDAAAERAISQTVKVEGGTRVHKRTIVKDANVGTTKISADRERRVQQARDHAPGASISPVFSVRDDQWKIGLGSDVAIMFDDAAGRRKCYVGSILTMVMKRPGRGSKKVRWREPVVLRGDRADLTGLTFVFHYYTFKSVGPTGPVLELNRKNTHTNFEDVGTIVFPVSLTFDPLTGHYTMPTLEYDLMLKAEAGTLVSI